MFKWNEVTWYSRLLASVFLIGGLPALAFYIGSEYQRTVALQHQALPAAAPAPDSLATYSSGLFGFRFEYPAGWHAVENPDFQQEAEVSRTAPELLYLISPADYATEQACLKDPDASCSLRDKASIVLTLGSFLGPDAAKYGYTGIFYQDFQHEKGFIHDCSMNAPCYHLDSPDRKFGIDFSAFSGSVPTDRVGRYMEGIADSFRFMPSAK